MREIMAGTRVLACGEDSHAQASTSELVDLRAANANLILRRFARRASFEATSAAANAKRTPEGVFCIVCSDLNRCQSFFPYLFRNSDWFKRSNKCYYRYNSNDRQPYLIIFYIKSVAKRKLRLSVTALVKK